MALVFPIVIAFLIFCVAVWVIGLLPIPAQVSFVRLVLYVVAGVLLILYLAQYA